MAMKPKKEPEGLFERIFDEIPIGLFLVAEDHSIYAWNYWMATNTKIPASEAINKTITNLYPNYSNSRFTWALDAVLKDGHPQLLSSVLNNYTIPITLDKKAYPELHMMQQAAEILPFKYKNQNMALVVIQDVTDKAHLKNTLTSMAIRFEDSSLVDMLTGLYNRRFLWKYLNEELENAKRLGYNVVCCLFDIDFFKKINDEYGHSAGDEVLVSFAKIAKATLRSSDHFIRYGGEEFLGIFTRIEIKEAIKLANRLRKKWEKTPLLGALKKKVTCSGGISYWQPSDPPINSEKLVDKADIELYKAKESGRNRIVVENSHSKLKGSDSD